MPQPQALGIIRQLLILVVPLITSSISRCDCAVIKPSKSPLEPLLDEKEETLINRYPRYPVTEPAWVYELLGPTEYPPSTTTPGPGITEYVVDTIRSVGTSVSSIPDIFGTLFYGMYRAAQIVIEHRIIKTLV